MADRHRNPAITPRPDPELKRRADEAVAQLGMSLNAYIIESLRYLVGDRDKQPPRPSRQ
jgi:predicted HicB family RNase H-like nuclease